MFDRGGWLELIRSRVQSPSRLQAVASTELVGTELEEVFDRLTRLAAAVLDVPWSFVTLVDDERSFWKSAYGTGATAAEDRANPVEESFCQYVVATGDQLLIADARLDDRTKDNPSIDSMGVVAWAGSPIRSASGHIVGTFCAVTDQPRKWSSSDAALLDTLAGAAASEVQLRTALRVANETAVALSAELAIRTVIGERSQLMAALAQELSAADSADDVARIVSSTGRGVLDAKFVNIELLDAAKNHMVVIYSPTMPADVIERYTTLALDESTPSGSAVLGRRPVMAPTRADFRRQWPSVADEADTVGVVAASAWPLIRSDGTILGSVSVGWSQEIEFNSLMRVALFTLAQMCAASLERSQVGDARKGFVTALQRALLPQLPDLADLEIAARYVPPTNDLGIGGDWYDVFEISPGSVAVIVGDVCGHGIEAAATMALLRGSINALTRLKVDSIVDVFDEAERWLNGKSDFVATVAVHLIDSAAHIVEYVSAGHPPAIIVRPDGQHELLERGRRPVLGVGGERPAVGRAEFPSGSLLVAYTDGVIERRGRPLDEGISRLIDVLVSSRHLDAEAIAAAVERSVDWSPLDDVAFAIIKSS